MSSYKFAETFRSVQGEGVYSGTPMLFLRLVGCSVGKTICHHCDTDFDKPYEWKGGGEFSIERIIDLVKSYHGEPIRHICLTGGEPFNWDLHPIIRAISGVQWHVETSGTVSLPFTRVTRSLIELPHELMKVWENRQRQLLWVSCSPKPGFIESEVRKADEIKVIVPGLGNGPGWPTLEDALRWSDTGVPVFLQPRNKKHDVDYENLNMCMELVLKHPSLRLSVQNHKFIRVR